MDVRIRLTLEEVTFGDCSRGGQWSWTRGGLEREGQLGYKRGMVKVAAFRRLGFSAPRWVGVLSALLTAVLLCATISFGQTKPADPATTQGRVGSSDEKEQKNRKEQKPSGPPTTQLKIRVTDKNEKPVGNASVYIRFYAGGGLLHHDKLTEMDFKTNQDGSLKVPPVPQGKIMIQIIATGWHTFGQWYDVQKEEETISIRLAPPAHWY
ncbi:MAG: carboxypeptidase-like regulatory domain-containing protein [Acidobacteriia bacterium]|nr:carboxypeptidase-like regulatory domain-containing protein [Terriglobia bacterium]